MNPMREIRVEKVVLNIGAGEGGDRLAKAEQVLSQITQRKPVRTLARRTIREWNVKRGQPIGCKVTLRGGAAEVLLGRLLQAVDGKVRGNSFDDLGNLSFGIKEHIDIPGISYDPKIGIFGLDVCVTLCRPGYRIRHRRRQPRPIPAAHRVTREEAMGFVRERFGVQIV